MPSENFPLGFYWPLISNPYFIAHPTTSLLSTSVSILIPIHRILETTTLFAATQCLSVQNPFKFPEQSSFSMLRNLLYYSPYQLFTLSTGSDFYFFRWILETLNYSPFEPVLTAFARCLFDIGVSNIEVEDQRQMTMKRQFLSHSPPPQLNAYYNVKELNIGYFNMRCLEYLCRGSVAYCLYSLSLTNTLFSNPVVFFSQYLAYETIFYPLQTIKRLYLNQSFPEDQNSFGDFVSADIFSFSKTIFKQPFSNLYRGFPIHVTKVILNSINMLCFSLGVHSFTTITLLACGFVSVYYYMIDSFSLIESFPLC